MDAVEIKKIKIEKLVQNLEDLLKQYRLLLDCVRKEKDILLSANIDQLNENNQLKESLTLKIKSLDQQRIGFATDLAESVGADTSHPRLLEIAQKLGGAESDKLRTQHAALEMVIKRLSELNKGNSFYAESALKTVSSALENFKDHLMGQKTYQQKGKYKQGPETSGHLVKKEA